MEQRLDLIDIPYESILHGNHSCFNDEHKYHLELYYEKIIAAIAFADSHLPRSHCMYQKLYWNDELSILKKDSIGAYRNWRQNGIQNSGPFFEQKKACHSKYKRALRLAQSNDEQSKADALYSNLLDKNQTQFWKSWRNITNVKLTPEPRIDGCVKDSDIADTFRQSFEKVYCYSDTPEQGDLKNRFF